MRTDRGVSGRLSSAVVLDSFAWIEYFSGSIPGDTVRGHIDAAEALTPTIVVAELSEKYRSMGQHFAPRFDFLRGRSRLVELDELIARTAGEINYDRKKKVDGWGMADSIVLATGRHWQAKILTGDPHFKDLTETIMLKRT